MDRKGILGIILCVVGIIGWQWYYTHQLNIAQKAQREAAALATPTPAPAAASSASSGTPATPGAAPTITAGSPQTPAPSAEEVKSLSTSVADYAFTNLGGGIQRVGLRDHVAFDSHKVVLNEFGSIPVGAVSSKPGEETKEPFTMKVDEAARQVTFERTDARQVLISKKFTLPKTDGLSGADKLREDYLVRMDLSFSNRSQQPVQVPDFWVHTGSSSPIHQGDQPIYIGFNSFRAGGDKFIPVSWFKGGGLFSSGPRPYYTVDTSNDYRWAGVNNQYFTILVAPMVDPKAMSDAQMKARGISVWAHRFEINDGDWREAGRNANDNNRERAGVDGAIAFGGLTLQPGETFTKNFTVYAGPAEYRRLRELGNNEEEIMNFGSFIGIFSKTLLNTMNGLHRWLGNYAAAIVVLTLIIKSLLWPLQNKATKSMKKTQALQPLITDLREKYKDDPQRMNMEMMKLYKDYGVNPFSGCLPMLIQIPIFFGFYRMLGKAVELRNAKFLWVHDLSLPDTIFHLGPIPVNPLPLLMAVTMFWQMAVSPKSGDPVQQRMFMFVPLIFIVFCYNYASALALYFTVQNLFSIVQLYATRKQAPPELHKVTVPAKKKSR